MKKPHFIIDEGGNKVGVLLTMQDYEDLLDKIDDEYSRKLFDRAIEVGEPGIPLEEYLKNRKPLPEERNVAIALYDLYKSLQEEVQADIRKLISSDRENKDDLSRMSNQSFADIWETPENDHWDQFLKDRLNV